MGSIKKAALAAALATHPSASVSDMPALADLLERSGWRVTPELSGIFQPGSVFLETETGHREMVRDCFAALPHSNTYTAAEVVTQLHAGVKVRTGFARFGASGGIEKKVKFDTPTHTTIEGLSMVPTPLCLEKLGRASDAERQGMYVVQEALTAVITEQTCGRVSATGQIVGIGSAEASASRSCARESLDPVVVGYRVVPVPELLVASKHHVEARAPKNSTDAVSLINHYGHATHQVGDQVAASLRWKVSRVAACRWRLKAEALVPSAALPSVGERRWHADFVWDLSSDPIRGIRGAESARWAFPASDELPIAATVSVTFTDLEYAWTGTRTRSSFDRYGFQIPLADPYGQEPIITALELELASCTEADSAERLTPTSR